MKLNESIISSLKESEENTFDYKMLDRLKSDCDYFLGNGNRNPKHLWAKSVDAQITKMKEIYNKLSEKPEWLTMEQIEDYEAKMKEDNLKEEYSSRLGGEPEDFISDVKNIESALDGIDTNNLSTKLAVEMVEEFKETCTSQISMTKGKYNIAEEDNCTKSVPCKGLKDIIAASKKSNITEAEDDEATLDDLFAIEDIKTWVKDNTDGKALSGSLDIISNYEGEELEAADVEELKQSIKDMIAKYNGEDEEIEDEEIESNDMDYADFNNLLYSSKSYEFDGSILKITDYYTGKSVKLDLAKLDEYAFNQLKDLTPID